MSEGRWIEVAAGVFARRYTELDLTTGLVVGDGQCLVIDTRGDAVQGAELASAVREITPDPWRVVITHSHFDHFYGTSAFLPCEVWAHQDFTIDIDEQAEWVRRYAGKGKAEIAAAIAATELVTPTESFDDRAELSIGGRTVVLHHFGAAHSFNDTVVHVPDADVVFAGDLVEHPELTAESFGDGDVTNWPAVLNRVLALDVTTIVPGHGEPVDRAFVAHQRDVLAQR